MSTVEDNERAEPDPAVAERLRRYTRSRDPHDLWPGLSDNRLRPARAAIERAVRAVLAGRTPVALDDEPATGAYALGIAALITGTGALLARWIGDGLVQAPDAAAAILREHLEHGRRRARRIEAEVLPALDALLARGITPVVVKGFHTARAYCEEPGVRPMADVDIVVPPDAVPDAEAALASAGFVPSSLVSVPFKRDWAPPRRDGAGTAVFSVERPDARNPWRLELHASFDREIDARTSARLDGEGLCLVPFFVAGRPLLAPAHPLLFLVLACQLASELDGARLMRLIDLVRVVRTDRERRTLDWDRLLAAFERSGAARFTWPAIALVEDLAPGTIDPRIINGAHRETSWGTRHAVRRLQPAGGVSDHTSLAAKLMWARGPGDVVATALATLWRSVQPGPQRRARWRSFLRHLRSGALTLAAPDERDEFNQPDRRAAAARATGDGAGPP